MTRLLHIDRPVSVRRGPDGRFEWKCLGWPACPGLGHELTLFEAIGAGVDHLRTEHSPSAGSEPVAAELEVAA